MSSCSAQCLPSPQEQPAPAAPAGSCTGFHALTFVGGQSAKSPECPFSTGWMAESPQHHEPRRRKDFTLAPCSVLVLLIQVCCVLSLLSLKHLSCQLLGRELCAVLRAQVCQPYVLHVGCAKSVDMFSPKCSIQEPCTSLDSLLT